MPNQLTSRPPIGTLLKFRGFKSRTYQVIGHPADTAFFEIKNIHADENFSLGEFRWDDPLWYIESSYDVIVQSRIDPTYQPGR